MQFPYLGHDKNVWFWKVERWKFESIWNQICSRTQHRKLMINLYKLCRVHLFHDLRLNNNQVNVKSMHVYL